MRCRYGEAVEEAVSRATTYFEALSETVRATRCSRVSKTGKVAGLRTQSHAEIHNHTVDGNDFDLFIDDSSARNISRGKISSNEDKNRLTSLIPYARLELIADPKGSHPRGVTNQSTIICQSQL